MRVSRRFHNKVSKPFVVKTAGGAASQILGLMNAIYISQRNNRPFVVRHYPYSTGSYYPIAIDQLLSPLELDPSPGQTKGLTVVNTLEVGKVIKAHPLLAKRFSYERLLTLIRRIGLESLLMRLKNEWPIAVSQSRLEKVPKNIASITGGYFPIVDQDVHGEMNRRFISAQIPSPFDRQAFDGSKPFVVIHYRIGDKRGSFAFPALGIDGIVDPESFKEILEIEGRESSKNIYVVSDEPLVAQELLRTVGINAKINPTRGDLWNDLCLMARAELLICPWSMVSQLAATIVVQNGRKVYYPQFTSTGNSLDGHIAGVTEYLPKFLPSNHKIYTDYFQLEQGSHKIY